MAKRKKVKKPTGNAAMQLSDDENSGPKFDNDSVVCLGATLFNVRNAVEETAIKRARGKQPVPLSAMKVALLEHDLGWALQDPNDEKEV